MDRALKISFLFVVGGCLYVLCEFIWRGYSHPAMFVAGGLCFLLIGKINNVMDYDTPLVLQALVATMIILIFEFSFGIVLNLWLHLNIWDYSSLWGNVLGQICPQFSAAWYFLSIGGIVLDDYLRYWLFGEEKPYYRIF